MYAIYTNFYAFKQKKKLIPKTLIFIIDFKSKIVFLLVNFNRSKNVAGPLF